MRIAQVAPLIESVPPRLYGGTERIVSHLTEELVRQGHEVTLYASGDSVTAGRLVPLTPRALRLDASVTDPVAHTVVLLERVIGDAARYDVIHFHIDHIHYPLIRRLQTPSVTTLHGRLDLPDLVPLFAEFAEVPLVSISDAQRAPFPDLNWRATVHHGLAMAGVEPTLHPGSYLAFLGRISPEKRLDRAIRIARAVGMPLRVAAKVDAADQSYFEERIRPLLDAPGIDFVGEIGEADKREFLGEAAALLFPIDWPEPFGLVMIEAMARGTPVLAFRNGSVPEVVRHGVSGMVVDSVPAAVAAVPGLLALDRAAVHADARARFGVERMTGEYVRVYQRLIEEEAEMRLRDAAIRRHVADLAATPHDRTPATEPNEPASAG